MKVFWYAIFSIVINSKNLFHNAVKRNERRFFQIPCQGNESDRFLHWDILKDDIRYLLMLHKELLPAFQLFYDVSINLLKRIMIKLQKLILWKLTRYKNNIMFINIHNLKSKIFIFLNFAIYWTLIAQTQKIFPYHIYVQNIKTSIKDFYQCHLKQS